MCSGAAGVRSPLIEGTLCIEPGRSQIHPMHVQVHDARVSIPMSVDGHRGHPPRPRGGHVPYNPGEIADGRAVAIMSSWPTHESAEEQGA